MKQILITGVNSYVGNALEAWLEKTNSQAYHITKISVRDDKWEEVDFSQFDSLIHVAGIAHVSTDPAMENEYYRVNRDLTIRIAEKAKADHVPQFVFLSSIIIYGSEVETIYASTPANPDNFYGKSKLEAEEGLKPLEDEQFKVAIIRPPMIYGKGSKGNYPKLAKLARMTPIFPKFHNERSMLHIDNLSEFIRLLIDDNATGTFYPQNEEYVSTSRLVESIAKVHQHKIFFTPLFNGLIKRLLKISVFNKMFSDLKYDQTLSQYPKKYQINNLEQSIQLTEFS